MGLLSQGSPLNWEETKKYADHIRKHGIIQFLNIYNKLKDRQKDVLKWGDEVRNTRRERCVGVWAIEWVTQGRLHGTSLKQWLLTSSTKVTFWNTVLQRPHF